MEPLHQLQRQFWNSLRSRTTDSICTRLAVTGDNLTPQKRLNIYRTTTRTAHTNALAQSYRCCEKILGERYFQQIANQYFYKCPAINQNLNVYGRSFPSFLEECVRDRPELNDYPYLPDLATLEWAYERAYYAADDPAFDFSALPALHHDRYQHVCFEPSASLSVLESSYPIYEIWLANQGQDVPQEIEAILEPQYLCITREDFKPSIHKIDQDCRWTINHVQNGLSLGELEALAGRENVDIQVQLPALIRKKWICRYYFKDN